MEAAFISRGQAILRDIYPERDERSRLYQYGFTPYVGRRFEAVVPAMLEVLSDATRYGDTDDATRLSVFANLGELLSDDRGFGFRVRSTATDQAILANWQGVLGWWMRAADFDPPDPKDLRVWQRIVSDNLEFRLGLGLGAVVARAWSDGVEGALVVPSLDVWRETTGLPWFAFWARELLRWGTLDPLVAFALSQGLAGTRNEGTELRTEFDAWLEETRDEFDSEDRIDPQLFLDWQRSRAAEIHPRVRRNTVNATLDGTNGERGRYSVVPVINGEVVYWIDAAGFSLAQSQSNNLPFRGLTFRDDFQLRTDEEHTNVRRTYSGVIYLDIRCR